MTKLYFGKFGVDKPEQITEKFYAAGPKGDTWYGGLNREILFTRSLRGR